MQKFFVVFLVVFVLLFFCDTFSLYTPIGKGVAKRDPTHVTPKLSLCLHAMFLESVSLTKVSFLAFFGPDVKTEMGVVIHMYSIHLPDYSDSKYIWVYP